MDKYVGKRLDGRYEIEEIIGVGGMAVVYKAYDNQENRTVAVKILKEEFISNQEFIRRFKNESKAIAMLSHQNIVKVYDVSFGDLIQYIVMEYIEGITLKEFIERQGSLRWKDAVHFTIQILRGLQHAHDKGIVHRDVKPQNIMVLPDGTIKVTDFGIARFARSDQRTITDKAIGSVHYISPEQARGEKTDEKSDIYSVGVMLYEMITGQMPFQADSAVSVAIMQLQREPKSPSEINGSIPQGLEQITMKAMQKSPERRYQSSAEMLCDLDAFRKDPAITFGYNYFVDSAPTKYVGTLADDEIVTEDEDEKEKNSLIPILTGVAASFVLALIVLAIIFIPKFLGGKTPEIACPNFIGMKWEDIEDNEDYKQFKFEITESKNNDYESGIVFDQSETEGEMLKEGALIKLSVSLGSKTVVVPNVYDMSETEAVSELTAKGFKYKVEYEVNEDVSKDFVIRTEPKPAAEAAEGATVTIYVSSGKPEVKITVPNVIGLKEDAAKKKLQEEGFTVITEDTYLTIDDKNYPVGVIAKQSPEASSTEMDEGTEVTIYVCRGYKFDLAVDLPMDLGNTLGTYSICLYESGTLYNKGVTVDGAAIQTYTFKDLTTTKESLTINVKVSADGGDKWYDYCEITVNNKTGKQSQDDSIADYEELVEISTEESSEIME